MTKTELNSERMKINNPMFNLEISKRVHEKLRLKYQNEPHPNKGRKRPDLTKRNLEYNPMKDIDVKEKAIKKATETRKRLYSEGKMNAWNKGMGKEEFLSHMPKNFVEKMVKSTHTEDIRKRVSLAHKKNWENMEYREKRLKGVLRGKNHPRYGTKASKEEIDKKLETMKSRGHLKIFSERMNGGGSMKAMAGNKRQSKSEIVLLDIITKNNLPFNYVGKGGIIFKGENHSFNPDFLSKNPKHIIEVFGDYWHNLPEKKLIDKERIETYSKYGYKTLVIWEHELKIPTQVIEKINKFIGGN